MKINYVLLYGTPYLRYELFDTFKKMSDFIVKRSIVNYTIFEKMEDKKEVEMIYRDSDIQVLEKRIDKAIEYINKYEYQRYCPSPYEKEKYIMREEKEGKELLDILRGEDNENNS